MLWPIIFLQDVFCSRVDLFTSDWVFGKGVTVVPMDMERHGRTVAFPISFLTKKSKGR